MSSDDVSLVGYDTWYSKKGIFMRFRTLGSSWCGRRRLIVVWYSRGIIIVEDATNVGDGLCSEIAARETENRENSASVVTDNHPVGSRCLARRSVAGMHFENAKTPVGLKTRVRTKIWTEI